MLIYISITLLTLFPYYPETTPNFPYQRPVDLEIPHSFIVHMHELASIPQEFTFLYWISIHYILSTSYYSRNIRGKT